MPKREPVYGQCRHCGRDNVQLARWGPGTEKCGACVMYKNRHGFDKPIGQMVDVQTLNPRTNEPTGKTVKQDAFIALKGEQQMSKTAKMHLARANKKIEALEEEVERQAKLIRRLKRKNKELRLLLEGDEQNEETA